MSQIGQTIAWKIQLICRLRGLFDVFSPKSSIKNKIKGLVFIYAANIRARRHIEKE
jgi:hypothetical protein